MKITRSASKFVKFLYSLADGGTHTYPDSVVQESIFAYLMSKSPDPVVTSFNNTTDSLEAISEAVAAVSVATDLSNINIDHLQKTACTDVTDPVDMTAEVVDNTVLANILTDDGDTSVYDRRTHSLEALYNGTTIRTTSAGTKTIASAGTKYLSFDSGLYGAEIISIIVKGLIGAAWTLDVYVPTDDAVASPAAGDKRDTITYLSTDTEGGLLQGFGVIFNGFLNFTNNGGGNQTISDVVIVYRSRAALTVGWEA